jgi:hypothetical protein
MFRHYRVILREFKEDDTRVSKNVKSVIIYEIIVHLLVIVHNDKRCMVQDIEIKNGLIRGKKLVGEIGGR